MMSEEQEAIEETKRKIKNTQEGLNKGRYYGERYNLEQEIKREEILLNYISRLQIENEELKNKKIQVRFARGGLADMYIIPNEYIHKDKIKETKEKVHWLLDKNGITRAYQLETDRYFEDLLKE